MTHSIEEFDAAVHPLQRGVNVVEASAGTGKTFSIAMLVLRFVAELGIPVEKILVVSYTRAATEELRTRIRKRLLEGRDFLRDKTGNDETLARCLNHIRDKDSALQHLELALLDMDRAAVFTIHGFCQRMLQEQALESGQLFDVEITADTAQIRDGLVQDYWRRQLYALSPLHCSLFLDAFPTPDKLFASVSSVGVQDVLAPEERILPGDALAVVEDAFHVLAGWWRKHAADLERKFREGVEGGFFKKKLKDGFAAWWQECGLFFAGELQRIPADLHWLSAEGVLDELHGNKLRGMEKKHAYLADWVFAGESIEPFLAACRQAVLSLRMHLALELQTGVRERLGKEGRFSFDDLVVLLAQALAGNEGHSLQKLLGKRFQAALIDEFQDTDVSQYQIFSALFGGGSHYLYLIGDPKQAIYKFRGADIFAYFEAKKSAVQLLGLAKNFRSSPLLVTAVNALFMEKSDSFVFPELPYHQVSAARSDAEMQFLLDDTVQPGMVYCCLESPGEDGVTAWTSGKCRERIEDYVRDEIAVLLRSGALLMTDTGQKQQVTAGDIAILVRSNKQAASFQEVLAAAGVPAIISSRISVFTGNECRELLLVIRAVSDPADMTALRTALSCSWFGMDGAAFYECIRDEKVMDSWVERFSGYHRIWQEKGFFVMMDRLLAAERVFETLAGKNLAERQISNISHLLELIQEAEDSGQLGISQTLQYIVSMREEEKSGESAELRLESDREAVQIVTMHGVKGLEYPIVFCPFLWYRSGRLNAEKLCLSCHDGAEGKITDLGSPEFARRKALALREELAEDVRLLYVALTRASYRCYGFWADVKRHSLVAASKDSAFSWVLSLDGQETIVEQMEEIRKLCDDETAELRRVDAVSVVESCRLQSAAAEELLSCRDSTRGVLPGEWLLSSYSALAGQGHVRSIENGDDDGGDHSPAVPVLPFGASFGNVVHGLLEDISFQQLAEREGYEQEIAGYCRRFGVVAEPEKIMDLLAAVCRTSLQTGDGDLFVLADLEEKNVLKEMPFYFRLRSGTTERLNRLLASVDTVQPVAERELKGYLTGFVDLIFRRKGKYYVVDYKTNYLGDRFSDYAEEKLCPAMRDHNYGLQYWIYALILHRYLQNTLPGYQYDQDFGGVFYLFARGMHPDLPGNGVFTDRPDPLILDELHRRMGGS